ncbi:MAG: lysophospholipid acyltransferase family protein [Spirochaetes bacterium]|nr:lysophospholipid acyltransferase family protein [Spirochaetota bacterium]
MKTGIIQRIVSGLLVNAAYILLYCIGITSSKKFINIKIREKFNKKKVPIIYAFWHNRLLYLAFLYRKKRVGVMVSQHQDGDYIAMVMKKCKLTAIRGSTTRGGLRALIEIINYAKSGFATAFTPDGPRGPKYSLQEGVLLAALKTGFPIVPICWNAKRKIVFNSWDNFLLPLPFNKFAVVYGKPVFVRSKAMIMQKKKELYKEMMKTVQIADNYFLKED